MSFFGELENGASNILTRLATILSLAGSHANPIMVTPDYVKKSVRYDEIQEERSDEHYGRSIILTRCFAPRRPRSAADLALLPFSSGTTGLPKGTMLSHQNITINLQQVRRREERANTII